MSFNTQIEKLEPFRLEPRFVERIWGTSDLRPWYDYVADGTSGHDPIGEVWLTGDECRVSTGRLAGMTLGEVFSRHSAAMLGTEVPETVQGASPLLMKVIFAREKLSVQVHPDDRLAQKYGQPRGKTECWYALAAEPGAEVAAGLRAGVTLAQVEAEVADGTLESSLEILPVKAGDLVFVDAGTVHAIWPGSVLLETQQNSDITYRLFDYGRPRELHVTKALGAIRLQTHAGKVASQEIAGDRTVLVDSHYFRVEKVVVDGVRNSSSLNHQQVASTSSNLGPNCDGLQYLFAGKGAGRISAIEPNAFQAVDLPSRGIVAIPASSPAWRVEDLGGLELVRITPSWPASGITSGI